MPSARSSNAPSPASARIPITPLTSLLTTVALDHGASLGEAQDRLRAALGLPAVELTRFDPVAETLAGTSDGPAVLAAHGRVQNAYVGAGVLLEAASGRPAPEVGAAVMSALAAQVVVGGSLDASDPAALAAIIGGAARVLDTALAADAIDAAAAVIAAANARIDAIPVAADAGFVAAVSRIESALQGAVAADLARLGAGLAGPDAVLAANTGAALDARIAGAPLGPLAKLATTGPSLANLAATPVTEGGRTVLSGSLAGARGPAALELLVNWGDSTTERVGLAPDATGFRLVHAYADDDPRGTPVDRHPIGLVLLGDGAGLDAASTTVTIANAAPSLRDVVHRPIVVAGAATRVSAGLVDPGALDTFTLAIDWGDTTITAGAVVQGPQAIAAEHVYEAAGAYQVRLTVTDDDGGAVARTLAVDVIPAGPPTVQAVRIGDGSAQRSMLGSVTVVFDQPVDLDAAAAALERGDGTEFSVIGENPTGDGRTWRIEFIGPDMVGGSLPDGRYELAIPAGAVVSDLGQTLADEYEVEFHRRFGDDDGDGDVDRYDFRRFRTSFKRSEGDPGFLPHFDYDGDDRVGVKDLHAFLHRFVASNKERGQHDDHHDHSGRGPRIVWDTDDDRGGKDRRGAAGRKAGSKKPRVDWSGRAEILPAIESPLVAGWRWSVEDR